MKPLKVLVIDDEKVICDACHLILSENGHTVEWRMTGQEGLKAVREGSYDVVLLDMKLPDIDGMEILEAFRNEKLDSCVIVMTGYSTISNAVEAMKLGAADYLSKPFTDEELVGAINKACVS